MINDVDLGRTPDHAAIGCHEADRPGPEHGYALSGTDIGQLGAVVASGEDVREHGEVRLPFGARRERKAVEVGEGHLQVFGLAADPRTHGHIAVSSAGEPWVDCVAEPGETPLTVFAEPTGNVEGHDHPVALFKCLDGRTNFLNEAHVFVAEDDSRLGGGASLIHVQVRAADAA